MDLITIEITGKPRISYFFIYDLFKNKQPTKPNEITYWLFFDFFIK